MVDPAFCPLAFLPGGEKHRQPWPTLSSSATKAPVLPVFLVASVGSTAVADRGVVATLWLSAVVTSGGAFEALAKPVLGVAAVSDPRMSSAGVDPGSA